MPGPCWLELDRTGEDQISLTDPDSRCDGGAYACGRGLQRSGAVDTKHKLIVEQQVTNQVVERMACC